jgi:hypothetical protein
MSDWLDRYPPLRVMRKHIAVEDYNCIRLGLIRSSPPSYLPLKSFCYLNAVLDETAWECIDECQNSVPVLAWTGFETGQRSVLHAPMECELRLYHTHAGLVMGSGLQALVAAVTEHCQLQVK